MCGRQELYRICLKRFPSWKILRTISKKGTLDMFDLGAIVVVQE
jgi:hypothetical protein